ncbi:DUF7832 domain-containing protein [Phytopseudomonas dryadis]|uniref:DUF7832 domain-containing protein n=1 Tax=Phytopseudomonas dryadis TaxID=2487520 RepID=A0ABY1Z084_9GAMM|nr:MULTISPECIES: hypothetical protein [Pseudomonas]TBV00499.1 hypothetical protein DNK34_23410 [Pseudomonas dryadis]TBV13131.1 hypothetical protein DNK41_23330 [Pseudomonas sp. FRB 230]
MKYDDASWHYEGDFPEHLPPEAGATHIGMFLAWLLLHGLPSEELREDAADELAALEARRITGVQFLRQVLDEKLLANDLDDTGNAFAVAYYQGKDDDSRYFDDYLRVFDGQESLYHVEDNWANYDRLAELIDERFAAWSDQGRPQYIL